MSRRWGWGLVGAFLISLVGLAVWYRPVAIVEAPLLPMTFGHADHRDVACTQCHHNFIDDSGAGICIDCHKNTPELAPVIEAQFHTLCRDCHAQRSLDREASGPLRACEGCHLPDHMP